MDGAVRCVGIGSHFDLESAMEAVKVTLPPVHAFAHWLELGDDEHRHQCLEDYSLSGH